MPPNSLMLTGISHHPQTLCSRNRNLRYNFYRQEIFKLVFCLTSVFFSYLGGCIKYAGEGAVVFAGTKIHFGHLFLVIYCFHIIFSLLRILFLVIHLKTSS